jgi:hypothetical protein
MRTNRVIVYASDSTAQDLHSRIADSSRIGWDRLIQIKVAPRSNSAPLTAQFEMTGGTALAHQISKDWHEGNVLRIFVEKSLKVKCSPLEQEGVKIRSCSAATIRSELFKELEKRHYHWLSHSVHEWEKAGIRHLHPQAWRSQFAKLGFDWVGEGLLKQLSVISDAELLDGVRVHDDEILGLSVGHGCVLDREPGSSSINVSDLLQHTYTSTILEIDFEEQPGAANDLDRLYVYEDGLWSGVELVKRLAMLSKWPAVQSRDLQVNFKFAATSDAGLCAARHFLRRERLTSVDISTGGVRHFKLLREGALESLAEQRHASDDDLRRSLDSHVEPFAFKDDTQWKGRAVEAMDICRRIGDQLVRPWIVRTKGHDQLDERAAKWALGAFGFASLTTFSKSVPKPVLPLLWLNGEVEIGGITVDWRPLFWDARRTGASPPEPIGSRR